MLVAAKLRGRKRKVPGRYPAALAPNLPQADLLKLAAFALANVMKGKGIDYAQRTLFDVCVRGFGGGVLAPG